MKHKIITIALSFLPIYSYAAKGHLLHSKRPPFTEQKGTFYPTKGHVLQKQDTIPANRELTFKAHLVNDEYQVWLDIDFYDNSIAIPGQDIFGQLPGYFGARRDTRKWIISEATVKGDTARLLIINDYGSEDLTAELKKNKDGSYTLTQLKGSTIKIVVNRKWVKIPKELVFKKR